MQIIFSLPAGPPFYLIAEITKGVPSSGFIMQNVCSSNGRKPIHIYPIPSNPPYLSIIPLPTHPNHPSQILPPPIQQSLPYPSPNCSLYPNISTHPIIYFLIKRPHPQSPQIQRHSQTQTLNSSRNLIVYAISKAITISQTNLICLTNLKLIPFQSLNNSAI